MKKPFKTLFFLLLISINAFSFNDDLAFTKQKNIKKAYIVNPDAILNINNSYGNINVSIWNEDKIELDILIKVSGDNEEWVMERLNKIDVDINALKNLVTAKTIIENSNYKNKGSNNSFEINYNIKIPKNSSIKLNNKYGTITTSDLWANTTIFCKYGKITLGKLNSTKNEITTEYCTKSTIEFIKEGTLSTKYSSIKIEEANKLELHSDYTDFAIENCDSLIFYSKYGKINSEKVKTINGDNQYTTVKIGEVSSKADLTTKYGNITINTITDTTTSVDIDAKYSTITIGYQPNFAFDFNVSTKYGDFKYSKDLDILSKQENKSSTIYEGYNKNKGIGKVALTSEYGNIIFIKK